MDNFPRVKNPLPAIDKPPASEPELRGFGNPADEAAGRKIMTYEEMLAAKAAADGDVTKPVTKPPSPRCNETKACNETPSEDVTKPGAARLRAIGQ